MENFLYTCQYCSKQYEPRRRGVQKYCSNSCRNKAYFKRNAQQSNSKTKADSSVAVDDNTPLKVEKMSLSGVGNAAAGAALNDALRSVFTSDENKPATKADIHKILDKIQLDRYQPINNLPLNEFGQSPFYDLETKTVVYISLKMPF